MMPKPIGTPNDPIEVHYDCRGKRAKKTFTDLHASRRFYVAKFKAGKNPAVVNPNKPNAKKEN